jgi:antitoxin (DNA-binding transcriptional repressor) of toxin-antitoxin stability system
MTNSGTIADMSVRVTVSEAMSHFSDLLDRVRLARETFVIVRGGEEVGQLAPVPAEQRVTLRGLLRLLGETGPPDERFAADLEEIQAAQPPTGDSPWPS